MAGQRGHDNKPLAAINGYLPRRRSSYLYLSFMLLVVLMLSTLMAPVRNKQTDKLPHAALSPTPMASPSIIASASPTATLLTPPPAAEPSVIIPPTDAISMLAARDLAGLIIPVAGVRASELRDTFSEARAEGRTHNAIDIVAPRGTAVLAAASGEVVKLFLSERGGNTIYQMSEDRKYVFYYAHLENYAAGLTPGYRARQGEVIGSVGDTGNAGVGNYHLHFSIWLITDPKSYWDGININPYPILHQALGTVPLGQLPQAANREERP